MTVHFIGAGPGAGDLLTLRGARLIRSAGLVLYAGSLVPREVLRHARKGVKIIDTAPLTLDEIIALIKKAHRAGKTVARVHSGDPSLYGAIAEQMRRLKRLKIPYDITPGVPSFAAAAAALKREFTLPGVSQTVILTRTATRSSPMPQGENLAALGRNGATLVIHLSINNLAAVLRDLRGVRGEDCPVAVVWRASWKDETIITGTLATIRAKVKKAGLTRTALIIVGPVLQSRDFAESRLYAADHSHVLRRAKKPRSRKAVQKKTRVANRKKKRAKRRPGA